MPSASAQIASTRRAEVIRVGSRVLRCSPRTARRVLRPAGAELPLVERLHRELARRRPAPATGPRPRSAHRQPSQLAQQVGELDRRARGVGTLVAFAAARAIERLLLVLGGEHAERDRHAGLARDAREAARRTRRRRSRSAAVSPRITAPSATIGVVAAGLGDAPAPRAAGRRRRARGRARVRRISRPVRDQRFDRARDQALDDVCVEARRDERDAQVADAQVALEDADRVHAASISGARALTPRSR